MKFTIITGSYPPDICGVGDYTKCVYTSHTAKDNKWKLYYKKNIWRLKNIFRIISDLKKTESNILIMEMPTMGYGKSLSPHLVVMFLSLFSKKVMIVRLHEYTNLSRKARFAISLVLLTANYIIFTNKFDQLLANKRFKSLKNRSTVIKIFSNIPKKSLCADYNSRNIDLIYFGHIRPNKGLSEYVSMAKELINEHSVKECVVVGQIPEGYQEYYNKISQECTGMPIRFILNASNSEVASILNKCKIAFLPFEDGLSERRGSFLASINNGCVVVSTIGKYTTPELNSAACLSNDRSTQKLIIQKLLIKQSYWEEKQQESLNFFKNEMPESWDDVAKQYIRNVKNICTRTF